MNKKLLSSTLALLLTSGVVFATEEGLVSKANETSTPKIFSALKKFDNLLKEDGYAVKLISLKEAKSCENPIVFLNGLSGYCGSGGCTMLVLDCTDEGYKVMGKTTVLKAPISLSTTSTNGYRDIKVRVKNTGIVLLKHDGKAYTTNASLASKSEKESSDIMLFDEIPWQ